MERRRSRSRSRSRHRASPHCLSEEELFSLPIDVPSCDTPSLKVKKNKNLTKNRNKNVSCGVSKYKPDVSSLVIEFRSAIVFQNVRLASIVAEYVLLKTGGKLICFNQELSTCFILFETSETTNMIKEIQHSDDVVKGSEQRVVNCIVEIGPNDSVICHSTESKKLPCCLQEYIQSNKYCPKALFIDLKIDLRATRLVSIKSHRKVMSPRKAASITEGGQRVSYTTEVQTFYTQLTTDASTTANRKLSMYLDQHEGGNRCNETVTQGNTGASSDNSHENPAVVSENVATTNQSYRRRKQPRYPHYINVKDRQKTYTHWPRQQPSPSQLANAGFFYTNSSDLARCFQCGIGLKHFSNPDDPLLEHIKHSGDCDYLGEIIESTELDNLKAGVRQQNPDYQRRQQLQELNTPVNVPQKPINNKHHSPNYESIESRLESFLRWPKCIWQRPQELAEAGLYYTGLNDAVRCFSCNGGFQYWEPCDDPWIEHCRWFPACRFALDIKGYECITMIQAEMDDTTPMTEAQILDDICQTTADETETVTGSDTDNVQWRIQTYVEPPGQDDDDGRLNESMRCMRCANSVSALFLPCKHHRLCMDCAVRIFVCPVCDTKISVKCGLGMDPRPHSTHVTGTIKEISDLKNQEDKRINVDHPVFKN